MSFLVRLASLILSVIMIPLSGVTYCLDLFSANDRQDTSQVNIVGLGAYFRSQGITCDGESLYFSSKTTLVKTETDARTIEAENYSAIPKELAEKYGIKHIGGLSYYNGRIYAGMEDSKVWNYPTVGVFDANSLELAEYYILDMKTTDENGEERLAVSRGLPWVAVDPASGLLYCTDHSKQPEKLLVFDTADSMKYVKEIPLDFSIPSIQGAEFLGGVLYAATNDDTQAIYRIDVDTGKTCKIIDRNLTRGSEGEGMTFAVKNGETKLIAIDLGPMFINAFVRQYDMEDIG